MFLLLPQKETFQKNHSPVLYKTRLTNNYGCLLVSGDLGLLYMDVVLTWHKLSQLGTHGGCKTKKKVVNLHYIGHIQEINCEVARDVP